MADKISPQVRQQLKQQGLAYLDSAGNAFLNRKFVVFIYGRKPEIKEGPPKRVFTNSGLKVIFLFLLDENLLNVSYRQIAEQARVALGNLPSLISGLREKAFLVKLDERKYKLTNKNALFERWIIEYEEKLKPTLFLGRCRFLKHDIRDWKNLDLNGETTFWGAEPAADILTDFLKPEALTIYTDEAKTHLMRKYQLVPDETGYIWLYRKFWQTREKGNGIVPPLLIYADLVNSGDTRNVEAARMIQERHLEHLVG